MALLSNINKTAVFYLAVKDELVVRLILIKALQA